MNMNWYRFLQTLTAIGALLIATGLLALFFGGLDYLEWRRMADWPATPGTVVESEIYTAEFRGRGIRYAPAVRITYTYRVGDNVFRGDRVSIETVLTEAKTAEGQRLLEVYPVGAEVTVFYDPADPATAVLERDPPTSTFVAALQLFALGAAALALRWLWRKRPYEGVTSDK